MSEPTQDKNSDPGLQALLARMKEAGQSGDEGVFSLDPEWVRKSLTRFVLPVPDKYILHAVASAVGAGATEVTVTITSGKTVITHDGKHPGPQELQNLFNFLLVTHDAEKVYLRELAIAANNARYSRTRVRLIAADSVCEINRAGKLTTQAKPSSGPFRMEFTRNRLAGWIMEVKRHQEKMLHANCEWSSARMLLGQSPLGTTLDPKACALWATFGNPKLRLPSATEAVTFEFPSTANGFVCLGNETGFRIVARGISYRLHGVTEYGGAYVVVEGDHLPFDVTGDQLQQGPKMDELVTEALKVCDRAVLEYLKSARLGGADTLDHLAKLFARRERLPEPQRARMEALTLATNGGPMTLGELWSQVKQHGHLLWWLEDVGAMDGAPVLVLPEPPPASFDNIFNTIELQETNHRLEDETCLVKIPGPDGGEWGILKEAAKSKEEGILPAEVTWSGTQPVGMLHELRDDLDRLYQALLLTQPVDKIQSHLLSYFKAVVDERETPFSESAAEHLRFRRADGETVTLSDLRRETVKLKGEVFGVIPRLAPDLPPETLLLSPRQRIVLPKLLEVELAVDAPIISKALARVFQDCTQQGAAMAFSVIFAALSQHGATKQLLEGVDLKKTLWKSPKFRISSLNLHSPEFRHVIGIAEKEAIRDSNTMILTHHFLLALVQTDGELTQRLSLDLEELRDIHPQKLEEILETYSGLAPSAVLHHRRAMAFYRHHRLGECLTECDKAIEFNPHLPAAHFVRAICRAHNEEFDEALTFLNCYPLTDYNEDSIRRLRIEILFAAQRHDQAEEELARFSEDDHKCFALRATLALHRGEVEKARDFCLDFLAQHTGHPNERALETLALAFDALGQHLAAKRAYRDFVSKAGQYSPDYRLAERIESARQRLQELETQYPEP